MDLRGFFPSLESFFVSSEHKPGLSARQLYKFNANTLQGLKILCIQDRWNDLSLRDEDVKNLSPTIEVLTIQGPLRSASRADLSHCEKLTILRNNSFVMPGLPKYLEFLDVKLDACKNISVD